MQRTVAPIPEPQLKPGSAAGRPAPQARLGLLERAALVVPFHNAQATLEECLSALTPCVELGAELHVVDDCSEDASADVTRRFPAARLHQLSHRSSSGGGRNRAALETTREFLIFVDADVVADREQILRLLRLLDSGQCDAAVGCYGEEHDHPGLVSQYKNLWIRRTYLHSPRQLSWFWSAFSVVRRDVLIAVGGFNEGHTDACGGVDFEFGWRLKERGFRTLLDPSIVCRHLKRFTLISLLGNDYRRARGYFILAVSLRHHGPLRPTRFTNIRLSHMVSGILAAATVLAAGAALLAPLPALQRLALILPVLWLVIQLRFLKYFGARRGALSALAVIPVLFLDELVSLAGVTAGVLACLRGERSPSGPGLH